MCTPLPSEKTQGLFWVHIHALLLCFDRMDKKEICCELITTKNSTLLHRTEYQWKGDRQLTVMHTGISNPFCSGCKNLESSTCTVKQLQARSRLIHAQGALQDLKLHLQWRKICHCPKICHYEERNDSSWQSCGKVSWILAQSVPETCWEHAWYRTPQVYTGIKSNVKCAPDYWGIKKFIVFWCLGGLLYRKKTQPIYPLFIKKHHPLRGKPFINFPFFLNRY